MPEAKLIITNEVGLHARPAALFVKTANRFKSEITVIKGELQANAKSILSLLTLGVQKGNTITVVAQGEDAEMALKELVDLNSNNFGENG